MHRVDFFCLCGFVLKTQSARKTWAYPQFKIFQNLSSLIESWSVSRLKNSLL